MNDAIQKLHIAQPLVDVIRSRYALNWHGIHGVSHWETSVPGSN
jgi:hypothetical protein